MNPKRIGIYGGSFNPIHVGHVKLAKALLRLADLDAVWFVVSPLNPFKAQSSNLLDDDKRLEMVEETLKDEEGLEASDVEFHLARPSYMLHTLRYLSVTYPQYEFVLLIGADNWVAFDRWYGYEEILNRYPVVVYPRRNSPMNIESLPACVKIVNTPLLDISSTEIREKVKLGLSVRGLVPDQIYDKVIEYYKD
ncbi:MULTISPECIES: nicotinate (nicotinamide) nucleotide adenylyltransferase [Segatella]|uniref:Probable nicotinate-nucleotide adenylyltransferase n=2 Tax=Segatella TaxID=2974251 RepID=D8DTG4_9BACT|nr:MULTISPECIES: nicotinate (nicotinamide) nucleotide adenylyltransferase [Segatella]EFI73264.1 nicotinate-nucleotide adenylyltransferase [Segatella baroniae B14]UKK74207.1 nicotinate-nucleotide adenylyltransferase [Segatella bryantii]UKK76459.1 nicotinate-nucleotide adenylyltransferase [Segatella bryantii]UKK78058.1 nicotinate-nucleotide adenylyltransferase [Segatella baroniae B14]SDL45851.1 nicotinate-nucleotide adenylyltransferase [Segatella bryantii]